MVELDTVHALSECEYEYDGGDGGEELGDDGEEAGSF